MKKIIINHSVIFALFVAGGCGLIIGTGMMFRLVLPNSDGATIALATLFAIVAWVLSWILRGLYISNRDLSINDMGRITLKAFIGACEEVYQTKYGKEDEPLK